MRLMLFLFMFIVQGCNENVTRNEEFKNIINKQFILQQDVFLANSDGVVPHAVYKPGETSVAPACIEDFIQYPKNWWKSDDYIRKNGDFDNYYHIENICVIRKDTLVHVTKVIRTNSDFNHLYVVGYLDDKRFDNIPVDITDLFKRHYFDTPKWFSTEDDMLMEKL